MKKRLLEVVGANLPAHAIIAIVAMLLDGRTAISIKDLSGIVLQNQGDLDFAGMCIRAKRLGTYKSGIITLTDARLLDLAAELSGVKPVVEEELVVEEAKPKRRQAKQL